MSILNSHHNPGHFFEGMFASDGTVRPHCGRLAERFGTLPPEEFDRRRAAIDLAQVR